MEEKPSIGSIKSGRDTNIGGTNFSGTFQGSNIAHSNTVPVHQTNQTTVPGDYQIPKEFLGKVLKEGEGGMVPVDTLPAYERIINNKLLPVSFLVKGYETQMSVCRILREGEPLATGFLVSKNVLMTNNHVFPDKDSIHKAKAEFGYNDKSSSTKIRKILSLLLTDPQLDFALVTINEDMETHVHLPPVTLKFAKGQYANIIGHPDGKPKMVSLRGNKITQVYENAIEYTSDTEPGSSGSPVFDNDWKLIALHSSAGKQDSNGNWISNKGFRIDKIVAHIQRSGIDEGIRNKLLPE